LPESPEEEQTQLMAEVRNATGKLSPQLQRLITEVAPDILRAALAKYPRDGSVKKPCSYLMKIIDQIKTERAATPKSASNETTTEAMMQWFQEACRTGVVFHDEKDFTTLPVVMNQICCRVAIPNRREIDPPYELRPIVELMKSKNLITP
jgi:predicted RNA polymerase sigma factor